MEHLWTQKITTIAQQKWLYKLIGFDFKVKYKRGRENVVVDALLRKYKEERKKLQAISQAVPDWPDTIKEETRSNTDLQALVKRVQI